MTTTWTPTPAGLVGLGGSAMRSCTDVDLRRVIGVSPAPRVAPAWASGVSVGSAARLRPEFQPAGVLTQAVPTAHNSIDGTTLGSHPSRRPVS